MVEAAVNKIRDQVISSPSEDYKKGLIPLRRQPLKGSRMAKSINIERNGKTLTRTIVDVADDEAEHKKAIGEAVVAFIKKYPHLSVFELDVTVSEE